MRNYKPLFWRNRHGEKVNVRSMQTSYLYNTVKMLWNNFLFPENPFGDVIKWTFPRKSYPPKFLVDFFKAALYRLKKREGNRIAKAFLAHVQSVPFEKREARMLALIQWTEQELLENLKQMPFLIGEEVEVVVNGKSVKGVVNNIGTYGGWCGSTGYPIPTGQNVYYVELSNSGVLTSFSHSALKKYDSKKFKVGAWVTADGWPDQYRICKITSRSLWLWVGKRNQYSHRMYFTTPIKDTGLKMVAADYRPSHEQYHSQTFGDTGFKPFKYL